MNKNLKLVKIFKRLSLSLLLIALFSSCKNPVDAPEEKKENPILDGNVKISSIKVYGTEATLDQDSSYKATVSKEAVSSEIAPNIEVVLESEKAKSTIKEEVSTPLGINLGDSKQYNIVVKAENASEITYKLLIIRGKSANAYLKSLTCNKGHLDFEKTRFAYRVTLPESVTELTVSETVEAHAEDANTSLVINPMDEIEIENEPIVTITVTAEDGKSKNEYSITFAHQEKLKHTELVDVINTETTIVGALPTWWDGLPQSEKQPYIKGVFVQGRTVKISPYKIGKYEVSYELWYSVKEWAKQNGYTFKHEGCPGTNTGAITGSPPGVAANDGAEPVDETKYLPVSRISWCDAVVWCNAYSQKEGVNPVYHYEGNIIKNANEKKGDVSILAYATMKKDADGYRLPTEVEWELAARGGDATLPEWNYRFGASDSSDGAAIALPGTASAEHPSKVITHLFKNRLGLFNMCGNMAEMCWDWWEQLVDENTPAEGPTAPSPLILIKKTKRGGCISQSAVTGQASPAYVTEKAEIEAEEQVSTTLSFRVARSSL